MNFTNFDLGEFFGLGDDTNPLMMLVWILPIVFFVLYGQQIQLFISASQIKKEISKLKLYKEESKKELMLYVKNNLKTKSDPTSKIDIFLDYFTIMPVDLDPNGIVSKIRHIVRSREDITREQVKSLDPDMSDVELTKIQTLIEIASTLQLLYKIINHLYLTAKKQKNFPMILPLQMMLPFIMEEAEALNESVSAFKSNQPVGDSIGPMVVGKFMLDLKKNQASFQTVWAEKTYCERKLIFLKAEGPLSTVGRPGDAVETLISKNKIDSIIMVDAAMKMEGEESATISRGFGAAIGGIGTERFQIEEIATKNNIPIFSIVIKESVKEAITLMSKKIAEKAEEIRQQIYDMIKENTKPGQSILIIGVGNTVGVGQ